MTIAAEDLATFVAAGNTLVLATVTSATERELLRRWTREQQDENPGSRIELIALAAGVPVPGTVADLSRRLAAHDEWSVVAVRVFWVPDGPARRPRLLGLLAGRDPYRPRERMQRRIMRHDASRARIVAGIPATVAELRDRWEETTVGGDATDFASFVLRRAVLSIERVEYRLLGPEYKSPRLVKPELLASARFRRGLAAIPGASIEEAGRILDEMATGWSRLSVDLLPTMSRFIYRRGFEHSIDYSADELETMRARLASHPAVLLFSHRSNLDAFVLALALQENRLPRAHIVGGINMAFGLMGPVMRRSGVIFIRRSIGDNALYKYVLKEYVGYLMAKRFNLTWSLEGTRSRTGKMLPPKLGLLSYVSDAYLERRTDDILLQPVSISFDQLHETAEYAAYARGGEKAPEGLRWFYEFIKAQGERHYGRIYVRFPEAVSMRQYLGDAAEDDKAAKRLALNKMAREVAWRILRATPVTATSLISTVLLTHRDVALTLDQLQHELQQLLDHLERTGASLSESASRLRTADELRRAVDMASGGHPVTGYDEGYEQVWQITPEHAHEAAFYRNSLIHAFLETSIVEMALAHALSQSGDRAAAFWRQAARLRDLLKFDFYFADSGAFRSHIAAELAHHDPRWEERLGGSVDEIADLLRQKTPLISHALLRPFFEAYLIVTDVLCTAGPHLDDKAMIRKALGVGRQYAAQKRIRGTESVSTLLFATGRQVAGDQGLLRDDAEGNARRAALLGKLTTILGDLDRIEEYWRLQKATDPPVVPLLDDGFAG